MHGRQRDSILDLAHLRLDVLRRKWLAVLDCLVDELLYLEPCIDPVGHGGPVGGVVEDDAGRPSVLVNGPSIVDSAVPEDDAATLGTPPNGRGSVWPQDAVRDPPCSGRASHVGESLKVESAGQRVEIFVPLGKVSHGLIVGSPFVADLDFPADLLELERSAWAAIQAGTLTPLQADEVQQAITAYAADGGHDRYRVEMALKKVVRHPEG